MRGIKRKAKFKDDTDREDFIERHSRLLQEMDADAIGPVRGHRRCVPLSWYRKKELALPTRRVVIARARALISYVATQNLPISESEVARRFNVDRSAISRATLRVSRDPELPAASKTMQREPKLEKFNIKKTLSSSQFPELKTTERYANLINRTLRRDTSDVDKFFWCRTFAEILA
jgi:hypothetical protein